MPYELAPVGNAITLRCDTVDADLPARFRPYVASFYGSGTAALAAAIKAAIRLKTVSSPEVIMPAYACPDVISAVLHAGARPVLADLDGLRPWMNLEQVEAQVSPNTVAVIAVNFLGIPERREALQRLAHAAGAILIEDSAQSCPSGAAEIGALVGDYVVLSFGRGKPVSLLGGGAVLSRQQELSGLLPRAESAGPGRQDVWRFRVRATAYNLLRQPRLYWVFRMLPFFRLGQTIYKPLIALSPEPGTTRIFLSSNLDEYQSMEPKAAGWIRGMLAELQQDGLVDLVSQCVSDPHARLLRYPVLVCEAGRRDAVYRALHQAGLGASRLYRSPLPRIAGVAEAAGIRGDFPVAQAFAESLLTLPTHAQVRREDIAAIRDIIARTLRQSRATQQVGTG